MVSFNLLIAAIVLVFAFQNCAKIQTANLEETDLSSLGFLPPGACNYEGRVLQNGDSVVAYLNSTVQFGETCTSEKRTCVNGVMSGSYNFSSCTPGAPADCRFNGETLKHGESVLAFLTSSVAFGESCQQQARTCYNGTISGSYSFPACNIGAPASCLFDGRVVNHGESIQAFLSSSVSYGSSCQAQSRTCTNGVLSGSYNSPTCAPDAPLSCTFNGQAVAHGQSVQSFLNSSVPFGQSCSQQTRTCHNGVLAGSYAYASCNVGAPASCLINGQQISHGQSIRLFKTSTVTFGQTCQDETRVCTNGSLNGSFTYTSCAVDAPAACQFNGVNMAHGQSVQAFASSTVAFGQTCQPETRSCFNGTLSGSAGYASCEVDAPKSCLYNGQTLAHGQEITAFAAAAAFSPGTCQSQVRKCFDGNLSGSYQFNACSNYLTQNKAVNVTNSGAIDILIIVDNSASMAYEQKSMASRTSKFLEKLRGLNYQIAITTTDPNNGTYGDGNIVKLTGSSSDYIIKSTMAETTAQTYLSNTLKRSETSSSSKEQAIYATTRLVERALASATSNAGKFLRADTPFAALVISDEDESGTAVKNTASNLLNLLNTKYSGNKPFSFHSIITRPDDKACKDGQGATYGVTYAEFSRITGGVIGDVCATDYSEQVEAIGDGVRKTARTITLSCMPAIDRNSNLVVMRNGSVYTGARSMQGLNLVFDDILPNGQYEIKYNCLK